MSNKHKASETLRQMALTGRSLSRLGGIAETVARLEEDNARKDAAIAEQARQLKEALAALEQVRRERDALPIVEQTEADVHRLHLPEV